MDKAVLRAQVRAAQAVRSRRASQGVSGEQTVRLGQDDVQLAASSPTGHLARMYDGTS